MACAALALLVWPVLGVAHQAKENGRLPKIGPAPEFALTTTDGRRLSLSDLRGKVVAVTFIYATCADSCPLLTDKMVGMQKRLGRDFGPKVRFVSNDDPRQGPPQHGHASELIPGPGGVVAGGEDHPIGEQGGENRPRFTDLTDQQRSPICQP